MDEELDMYTMTPAERQANWGQYGERYPVCRCHDCRRLRHNSGRHAAALRRYLAQQANHLPNRESA